MLADETKIISKPVEKLSSEDLKKLMENIPASISENFALIEKLARDKSNSNWLKEKLEKL